MGWPGAVFLSRLADDPSELGWIDFRFCITSDSTKDYIPRSSFLGHQKFSFNAYQMKYRDPWPKQESDEVAERLFAAPDEVKKVFAICDSPSIETPQSSQKEINRFHWESNRFGDFEIFRNFANQECNDKLLRLWFKAWCKKWPWLMCCTWKVTYTSVTSAYDMARCKVFFWWKTPSGWLG